MKDTNYKLAGKKKSSSPISIIQFITKSLLTKKTPGLDGFTGKFYQICNEEMRQMGPQSYNPKTQNYANHMSMEEDPMRSQPSQDSTLAHEILTRVLTHKNCDIINLGCFKPLILWLFVMWQ